MPDIRKVVVEELLGMYSSRWEEKEISLELREAAVLLGMPISNKQNSPSEQQVLEMNKENSPANEKLSCEIGAKIERKAGDAAHLDFSDASV